MEVNYKAFSCRVEVSVGLLHFRALNEIAGTSESMDFLAMK
jgi:hypothetical protein